jgi:hypothetical protein
MRFMTALSSRGKLVPTGGWPMAVAERLWPGCALLELLGCRELGLSFSRRRDSSRVRLGCDEVDAVLGVRCDDDLGGGMGPVPLVVAVLFIWGEFCVDGGSGCARGVFTADEL